MSNPIARIRSAVLRLIDTQERDPANSADLCAQFYVNGDKDRWLQLQLGTVNFAYPHQQGPIEFLANHRVNCLAGLTTIGFRPQVYATLGFAPCSVEDLFRFVDGLLTAVHALPPQGYSLELEPIYLSGDGGNTAQRGWYAAMPSRWHRGTSAEWREPLLATDRWELASAEERNRRSDGRFEVPSLEDRSALAVGDIALLLFRMLESDWPEELELAEERMWVLVTESRPEGRFLGRLVNQPDWVDCKAHYLTLGSEVPFRLEHIVEINRWEPSDIDDFLARSLHRRWI